MTNLTVEAELREETGRSASRRLRRAGKIPGIIYGGGKPDLSIAIDRNIVDHQLNDERFHTSILDVKVKGSRSKNSVLLKDSQWDPITDAVTHLDFFRVAASDTISMEIPVLAINHEKCPGIVKGGLIDMIRHTVEVTCRADSIPENIEVDCARMDIGDSVHIEDVDLPEGVEVVHDVNFTVLNLSAPKAAEVSAEEEEAEAEGAEEGAASE
jgi:large subunit ribosomal protein L25